MKMDNITEGLAELAGVAERDHEVQMARAELYKIAKYAIKLHEMLKSVSEAEGIEGWQQSKITKAADYMGSVYHAMDYDNKFADGDQDLKAGITSSSEVNGAAKGHQATWKGGSSFSEARSSASDQAAKAGAYNGGKSIAGKGDGKAHLAHKLKGDALQKHRDAGVAKMDAEDKAARKAQADKFAAMKNESVNESEKDTHCSDKCCGADVKREDCKCSPDCKHCNCNDPKVAEGLRPAHAKELRNKELNKDKGPAKSGKTTGPDDYDFLKYKNKKEKETKEGKSPHAKGTKKYKKHMAAMHAEGTDYKKHLELRVNESVKALEETANTCPECGNTKLTASEKKELAGLEEGKKHGNSKIYKKCWKGCTKVAGKKRGEPGSCKCD